MDTQQKIYKARSKVALSTQHGRPEDAAEARIELTALLFQKYLEDHHDHLKDVGADRLTEIINQNI